MAVAEQEVPSEATWPAVFAPLALVAGLGGAIVGGVVVLLVAVIAGADAGHPPAVVSLISTVFQDAAFIGAAVFFAAQIARPRPSQFGLRPPDGRGRAFGALMAGYGVFLGFSALWVAVLNLHDKEKIVDQLGANNSAAALVAVCLLTCVIAPIAEEIFFRGFFFAALRNRFGPWPAALVTGIVFGGVHAGSAPAGYLVPLGFLGVVLCIVYWQTGSLYPCIGLHALNNAVAFGITEHWGWEIAVLTIASLTTITLALRSIARLAPAG
jgi:membrane protease YdiL (CAAX protease family)